MDQTAARPLLATADLALADELARLAAAAGAAVAVCSAAEEALRGWGAAPVVLLGADLAGAVATLTPPRRAGVQVVSWSPPPPAAFRDALAVGAEGVVELPAGAGRVSELLTDLAEAGRPDGVLVGVVGGSGGAGATTLACALAQGASARGPALVVDLDPLGPGCDRVLALEDVAGVRWDSLGATSGRLSGRSLREAVPRREGPGVLAWPPTHCPLDVATVREALSAARRGHDVVVVDLPRTGDLVPEVAARCALLVVVVVPTVTGVAAAARWVAAQPTGAASVLVVRGRGADARQVGELVGLPVAVAVPDQRGLAESLDLGLGPLRSSRGPMATAVRALLESLPGGAAAVAGAGAA